MENKENSVRLTRLAKKRLASAVLSQDQQLQKKKRVVLGELPNISNVVKQTGHVSEIVKVEEDKKAKKVPKLGIVDIDSKNVDPQLCPSYAPDIFQYLRSMEVEPKRRPLPNYIEAVQRDITSNMRSILVDWLVEVTDEYKLITDTLFLAVSYIDRFLSVHPLNRQKLQLLGVSCMLIASKYEEISPPHVEDFCYITDNTYAKTEVVKMERDVLNFLNFEMGNPTIKTFLRRFTKAAQENSKNPNLRVEFLGAYLAELSLLDYRCLQFLPSKIAASVVFVSKFTLNSKKHPWCSTLQHYSNYKPSELKDCVHAIHALQLNKEGSSLMAIRDKYNSHKFKCVSSLSSPSEIPENYFDDIKE